jgi:hypothetical protein
MLGAFISKWYKNKQRILSQFRYLPKLLCSSSKPYTVAGLEPGYSVLEVAAMTIEPGQLPTYMSIYLGIYVPSVRSDQVSKGS